MDTRKFSYDPICETIAEYFLADERDFLETLPPAQFQNMVSSLSQDIQNAIESWFNHDFVTTKEEYENGKNA